MTRRNLELTIGPQFPLRTHALRSKSEKVGLIVQQLPKKLDSERLPSRSRFLAEAIGTTIRSEFRVVPTDSFLLCAIDHSTKIYGPLSFIFYFVHDHLTKI